MITRTVIATLALALLAACQDKADNLAIDDTGNDVANVEALPPSEGDGNSSQDASALPTIPAQYRGRWGMNKADCDPARSDAKGLIIIDPMAIRFYESVATLKEQRPAIATSFSGDFDFAGEGRQWEKVETLTLTGDTLKRADEDGTFSYRRCT